MLKFEIKEGDKCPYCHGTVVNKNSRFGEFHGCDQFPRCGFSQNIKQEMDIGMAGYND